MAKYVDVPLDKARRLRYTVNGIRELERHFGASFSTIFSAGQLGFEQIIMLLTVGLKYGDPDARRPLSDVKVGELVQDKWLENGKTLGELTEYVVEAMNASGIITLDKGDEEEVGQKAVTPGGKKELPNV